MKSRIVLCLMLIASVLMACDAEACGLWWRIYWCRQYHLQNHYGVSGGSSSSGAQDRPASNGNAKDTEDPNDIPTANNGDTKKNTNGNGKQNGDPTGKPGDVDLESESAGLFDADERYQRMLVNIEKIPSLHVIRRDVADLKQDIEGLEKRVTTTVSEMLDNRIEQLQTQLSQDAEKRHRELLDAVSKSKGDKKGP